VRDDDWVSVTDFSTRDQAQRAGASLLESGIVATVDDEAGLFVLSVMPDDVSRACELLGVPEPTPVALPLDEPLPVESTKWRLPRERLPLFIIGYLVVLVGMSAAIFFVVVWLLGGYDSTEMPTITTPS
jgi:hypothetical protein